MIYNITWCLFQNYCIREFRDNDSGKVLKFVSHMLANEFKIIIDYDNLDSDLLDIKKHYNRDDGGCFWVVERKNDSQILGTVAIRKLNEFASATAELKRMFLSKKYRGLGIGQKMLDTALDFAIRTGYFRILLYSSKELKASRALYLKNGFMDIPRYNNDLRADVFMEKKLL
jgi:GNAT superfamily N-acetyltransferase